MSLLSCGWRCMWTTVLSTCIYIFLSAYMICPYYLCYKLQLLHFVTAIHITSMYVFSSFLPKIWIYNFVCPVMPLCNASSWYSLVAGLLVSEIQEKLSDVVNNLVKHFCKTEKEVSYFVASYLLRILYSCVDSRLDHLWLHVTHTYTHSYKRYCTEMFDDNILNQTDLALPQQFLTNAY